MFNQYNEPNNYMTLDSSSLNPYNYKNMESIFQIYQQYQNLYYYTRQINPISLANVSPQSCDPSNLPCDIRLTIYDGVDGLYGNDSMNAINHLQTHSNNPNNWCDNIADKPNYHNQYEHTNNYYSPISAIKASQTSSNIDYHGYLLF